MSEINDVKPGDVLLFNGNGFVAKAIRFFDKTTVNHAALALEGGQLAEAAGNGLQYAGIRQAVQNTNFTHVRRLRGNPDLAPVIARGRAYVDGGSPYAYQQIAFLAILGLTRQIPLPPLGRRLMRATLDKGAAALNSIVDSGKQFMICSEFVYRAYAEAYNGVPPNPYGIQVLPGSFAATGPTLIDWALDQDDLPQSRPALSFGGPGDTEKADAEAEAELAPLIGAYLAEVEEGPTPDSSIPGTAAPEDAALLQSMVDFSASLHAATSQDQVSFALPSPRALLDKVQNIAADPNFVTPGDLLRTGSLVERFRLQHG